MITLICLLHGGKNEKAGSFCDDEFDFHGSTLSGYGSTTKVTQGEQTTLGQQLIDLDKAYKQGIIPEDQYEKSKKELLKKYR
jgi:putative N-acetylmannosamine-6-phosphate epimerase